MGILVSMKKEEKETICTGYLFDGERRKIMNNTNEIANNTYFCTTSNKDFQMTFENGLTIFCQFENGNYCNRRDLSGKYGEEMTKEIIKSPNCKIAIWNKDDIWITSAILNKLGMAEEDVTVADWLSPNEVSKIIGYISTLGEKTIKKMVNWTETNYPIF